MELAKIGSEILTLLLTGAVVVLWWLLKRDRKNIDVRFDTLDAEIKKVRADMETVKVDEAERYEGVKEAIHELREDVITAIGELKTTRAEFFVTKAEYNAEVQSLRTSIQAIKDHCYETHLRKPG
jgi:copper chaperone CopZ